MSGNQFVAPLAVNMIRLSVIDDQIEPSALHLLRIVPLAWVTKEMPTKFKNMPTEFGPASLEFRLLTDGKTLDVSFTGQWRSKPQKIVLHTLPGSVLKQVRINGKNYAAKRAIELE